MLVETTGWRGCREPPRTAAALVLDTLIAMSQTGFNHPRTVRID